jgi:hypothetical protein
MRIFLWLLSMAFGMNRPPSAVNNCPDFVDPDGDLEWLDDPDEIENARWFAQGCYELPAAKR